TLAWPVRLLGQAVPGEILVSLELGALVEGWYELEARAAGQGLCCGAPEATGGPAGATPTAPPESVCGPGPGVGNAAEPYGHGSGRPGTGARADGRTRHRQIAAVL